MGRKGKKKKEGGETEGMSCIRRKPNLRRRYHHEGWGKGREKQEGSPPKREKGGKDQKKGRGEKSRRVVTGGRTTKEGFGPIKERERTMVSQMMNTVNKGGERSFTHPPGFGSGDQNRGGEGGGEKVELEEKMHVGGAGETLKKDHDWWTQALRAP